ncbi:Deoxycytidine monophosphate (dCMP) deaminase [Tieghemiomyces parasiticus]|uniref:Deoxycytidylate deaminase n=1 Tax=Tieghemiomyces parasiticus TaxID=78921 RepID=A0A9W8AC26_9FUNG|nr:Deoxycytidine monophosphate (dCMP) deaminase [Tieghemiomyces parasiticus]
MFISIIGTECSGKKTTLAFLADTLKFQPVALAPKPYLPENTKFFTSVAALLLYATQHWRENFVVCDIDSLADLTLLRKRPFFLLIAIDAPTTIRYKRLQSKCNLVGADAPNLGEFLERQDRERFYSWAKPSDKTTVTTAEAIPFYKIIATADMYIVNSFADQVDYFKHLEQLRLDNPERLRPSWDTYFMLLSELASRRSNCMKRRVGCILVKDNRIISTGYNGSPRGIRNCADGGCPRCNAATPCGQSLHHCLCLHAEENALLEAGRVRVEGKGRCILYCNTCPCLGCAKKIVQVGVQEVVYSQAYGMDELSARVFSEAGVILRQHIPPILKADIEGELFLF